MLGGFHNNIVFLNLAPNVASVLQVSNICGKKGIINGRHGFKISSLEEHDGTRRKWKMTSEKTTDNNNNGYPSNKFCH